MVGTLPKAPPEAPQSAHICFAGALLYASLCASLELSGWTMSSDCSPLDFPLQLEGITLFSLRGVVLHKAFVEIWKGRGYLEAGRRGGMG